MAILQSSQISGSLSISGSITAQSIIGDGSSLTGVVAVAPAGTVSGSAQVVSLLGSHSGNVGIGTISPSSFANYKNLSIKGGSSGANLDFHNSSGTRVAAIVSNPSTNFIVETNETTPIVLKTNDTERMRIDSSGNVGIGTTSPGAKLDVSDSSLQDGNTPGIKLSNSHNAQTVLLIENTTSRKYEVSVGGSANVIGNGSFYIYDATGGDARLVINSSGNVGIGTTSPSEKLHVVGAIKTSRTSGATENTFIYNQQLAKWGSSTFPAIIESFGNNSFLIGSSQNIPLHLARSGAIALTVGTDNNVGIGTTSPSSKLSIEGAQAAIDITRGTSGDSKWGFSSDSTSLYIAELSTGVTDYVMTLKETTGNVGIGTTSPDTQLHIVNSGNGSTSTIKLEDDAREMFLGRDQIKVTGLDGTTSQNLYIQPTGNTAFATTSGNVGIGTTSPSAKLDVHGDIYAGDGTADNIVRAYYSDNTYTEMKGYGLQFSRNASYIRPTVDNTKTMFFGVDALQWNTIQFHSLDFQFKQNNSVSMRLDTSGDLLIGGTSKLTGYSSTFRTLSIQTPSGDNASILELAGNRLANPGNQNAMIQFFNKTGTATEVGRISSTQGSDPTSGSITFHTRDSGTFSAKVRIDSNGNVGIGTTSPDAKLQIGNGTSNTTRSSVAVLSADGGNGVLNALSLVNSRTAELGNGTQLSFHNANNYSPTGTIRVIQAGDTTTDSKMDFQIYNSGLQTALTIDHDSNVGIGITSPDEKLSVNGNIFLQGNDDYIAFNTSASSGHPKIKMTSDAHFSFLNTAGTNTFHIENGGNVGIGTTSPTVRLEVASSTSNSSIRTGGIEIQSYAVNNSWIAENVYYEGGWRLRSAGYATQMYMQGGTINFLRFPTATAGTYVSPTSTMFLGNSGNVGIGTTSPVGKLYVGPTWNTSYGGNSLYIKDTSVDNTNYDPKVTSTTALGMTMVTDSSTTTGPDTVGLTLYNDDNTAGGFSPMLLLAKRETGSSGYKATMAGIYARSPLGTGNGGNWIDGELIFATAGAATQGIKQRMVINKEGNVGIGTTSPSEILHISKSGNTTKTRLQIQGGNKGFTLGKTQQDADYAHLRPLNSGQPAVLRVMPNSTDNNAYLEVWSTDYESDTSNFARGMFYVDTNNHVYLRGDNAGSDPAGNLYLGTDSVNQALTILNGGNVGIGTTSPSAKLDIVDNGVQIRLANSTTGTTTSDGTRMYLSGNDLFIVNRESANIQLYTTDTERMRITSGGELYIDTTGTSGADLKDGAFLYRNNSGSYLQFSSGTNSNSILSYFYRKNAGNTGVDAVGSIGYVDTSLTLNGGSNSNQLVLTTGGNVGIGTTDPGGKLDVAGNIEAADQVSVNNRTAISVAHWGNGSSSSTGAVKIQIPGSHGSNWSMLVLRITTYEYNSTAATVYYVSGHDWTSGWYNNGVTKIGTSNKDVSLGYDSNYDYVIVGGTSSTWNYGHVTVDVVAHPSFYSSSMDITTGWAISQVTSLSGITVQSVTNKRVLTTSDEGSGNGLDADLLDGIDSSAFLRSNTADTYSSTIKATGNNWYLWGLGARGASAGEYGIGNGNNDTYRQLTFHVPDQAAYGGTGTIPSFGWYSNNATELMKLEGGTGHLRMLKGDINAGDGTANTRVIIDKADNNVADHLIFEVGGTRVGEIGAEDTSWLRINQVTNKNIYTPRYIRADGGFFVDSTAKGINGSGNFIGGTITGASDANVSNWNTAYNNHIVSLAGSGDGTLTLTQQDGGTISTSLAHSHSEYVEKNVGYIWTSVGINALSFTSNDTIDTASGDQASLEVYQDTPGADAFMQFHVSGDYAKYFGLHGGINDFVVGGWSYGAGYQRVFHDGYHPNADAWTTSRTITLGGDLSGNVSIDGSANVTLTAAVANDSHTHDGRYYTETESDSRFVNVTGDTMTGALTVTDSGTGINIDTAGHASLRLDRASSTYDNNLLFFTGGVLRWRLWQDGDDDYLYIRDEDNSDNMVTFKKGGNVGIGTSNMYARLNVRATSHTNGISVNRANDGTAALYIGNDGGSNPILAANNADMIFGRDVSGAFTERMRLTNSGNLGIGTTTPTAKLQVEGSGSTIFDVQGSQGQLFSVTDDLTGTLFSVNDISGIPILSVDSDDTVTMGTFGTNALVVSGSKVGIGTDSPTSKLSITDSATMYAAFEGVFLDVKRNASNGNDTTSRAGLRLGNNSNGFSIFYGGTTDRLRFIDGGNNEVLSLVNGGNVGINYTSPIGQLHVDNNIHNKPTLVVSNYSTGGTGFEFQRWQYVASSTDYRLGLFQEVTSGLVKYRFDLVNNGTTYTSNLVLDRGNVGIGTSSPASILNTSGAGQGITHDDSTTGKGYLRFRNGGTQLALFGIAGAWEGSTLQDTLIAAETGHNIRFYTNGTATPKMYISSSGNVGIGDTSPSANLQIGSPGANLTQDLLLVKGGGSSGNYGFRVQANNSENLFIVDTLSYNVLIPSGNVGIGNTSPSDFYSGANNLVVGNNSGENGITIYTGSSNTGFLLFSDGTSGNEQYKGQVRYDNSTDQLQFLTAGNLNPRLLIDSSGNVLVGKTASSLTTVGIELRADGNLYATRAGAVASLNRENSDGTIVDLRKDGTTIGVIGSTSTAMELSTPNGTSNTVPSSANGDDARDIRIAAGNGGDGGSNGDGGDGGSIILDPGSGGNGDNSGPNGQVNVIGTLTKSAGSFKINHPDPVKTATHDLYHSFVESPTAGDNIYRWQVTTTSGSAVIDLPDYYQHLNENDQVWVSPVRHFGQGYGEVSTDQTQLNVYSNTDGVYNVLLIGTRKDLDAVKSWKGVERLK